MDVILAHQYGFTNVVASMGTAISEIHAQTLKKITKNVVLALDADAAGEEAMARSAALENVLGGELRVAVLPEGKDPDEVIMADPAAWQRFIDEAQPVTDFIFSRVTAALDLKSAQGRTGAAERLMPVIGQIQDIVRQTYYLNKLAELTGVDAARLKLRLATPAAPRPGKKAAEKEALTARPREDYCLAMLLKYPELVASSQDLLPEYLESTENREILRALRENAETAKIEDALDGAIWQRCQALMKREFPADNLETKLSEGILRLREDYLKRLAQRRSLMLSQESAAALPDEQDMEVSRELQRVFLDKERLGIQKRRKQ
jgi:DNA primase